MQSMVTGRKPVLELMERDPASVEAVLLRQGLKGADIRDILEACKASGVRYRFVPEDVLRKSAPEYRQGVAAFTAARAFVELEELLEGARVAPLPVVVALDQVQDPGNAGSLARTLLALGGGGLIVPKHHGARLGGAASKVSAGALEQLPVRLCPNLSQELMRCAEAGFTVYKAEAGPQGSDAFKTGFTFPLVLVLGGEDKGVRPLVSKRCDASVFIPMPGMFDSLNVAQAGAIVLGQMARQAFA